MRWMLVLLLMVTGCDRRPVAVSVRSEPQAPSAVHALEAISLAKLVPKTPTHIAVDRLGNVLWVQESPEGSDRVWVSGDDGTPRATQLTSRAILDALDVQGGSGNIQSLSAGPDGEIYFYFAGGKERQTVAGFGRFALRTRDLMILADTKALESATGMGRSMELARGTVRWQPGGPLWLWVRHSDAYALFRFDPEHLSAAMVPEQLRRPVPSVRHENTELPLTREAYRLAAALDGTVLLADPLAGAIWKISRDGTARIAWSLVALPRVISQPAALSGGRAMLFIADAELIVPASLEQLVDPPVQAEFPALLVLEPDRATAVPRERISGPSQLWVWNLQLAELLHDPTDGTLVGYDTASGELLRLKLKYR